MKAKVRLLPDRVNTGLPRQGLPRSEAQADDVKGMDGGEGDGDQDTQNGGKDEENNACLRKVVLFSCVCEGRLESACPL